MTKELLSAPQPWFVWFIKWMLRPPCGRRSFWSVGLWWEAWRIPYNLVLLLGIVVSVTLFMAGILNSTTLAPGEDAVEPLALMFGVPFGIIMANVCYCIGPVVEFVVNRIWAKGSGRLGLVLLILGMLFSLGLVLLPGCFGMLVWILPPATPVP